MNERKFKIEKDVFVIMPFIKANNRNQEQLTSFFNALQSAIEAEDNLTHKYKVRRSGDDFNITDQIIRNLFNADIVIADISGKQPNPNVMYELGVRLALSEKPVILIREGDKADGIPFDLTTYHTTFYDPFQHEKLVEILVDMLKRLESGEMQYESPVKKALQDETNQTYSILRRRERLRAFCSRVAGGWWQRILEESVEEGGETKRSLSFVQFEPDEVTNEVRIKGHTYDQAGTPLGKWESVAVGIIMEPSPKILYYWEAEHERPPGMKTSGFGEFEDFRPSEDVYTQAMGHFMNTQLSDRLISWWKSVRLRKILNEGVVRKMDVGSEREKREEVTRTLEKWDEPWL